MDVCLFKRCVL